MKIAIVGAGPSGLCTAKELSEFNHHVTVFEATSKLGGVFAHSYHGLHLVNNNMLIAFSCFFEGLSATDLTMWSAEKYVDYLYRYGKHFDIYSKIEFSTKVTQIKRQTQGWFLTVEKNGRLTEHQFDYVVVCTGIHASSVLPKLPNQDRYKGKIIHGNNVINPIDFKGKNVVLIGTGEYGSDLAYLIGSHSKSMTISVRRWPSYIIPRYHDGVPTDLDTSRLRHSLSSYGHLSILSPLVKLKRFLEFKLIKSVEDKTIQKMADELNSICADVGVLQRTTCKNESLVKALLNLGAQLKPDIVDIRENSVVFSNGTETDCEIIICCTGFKPSFPFLDESLQKYAMNVRGMAHYMFPPHEDRIAFIGFIRPGVGSIPPMAEMQVRYLALVLSGHKKKPNYIEAQRLIYNQKIRDFKNFPLDAARISGLTLYFDFLSDFSKMIGCEPKKYRLLFTSPYLFFKTMCSFLCTAQFRLYGPGANRQEAAKIIKSLPTVSFGVLIVESLNLIFKAVLHFIVNSFQRLNKKTDLLGRKSCGYK